MSQLEFLYGLAEREQYQTLIDACLDIETPCFNIKALLALSHAQCGNFNAAKTLVDTLLEAQLEIKAQLFLCQALLVLGQNNDALQRLHNIRCHDAKERALFFKLLAAVESSAKHSSNSIALLEKSLSEAPSIEVYTTLVAMLVKEGFIDKGWTYLSQACSYWDLECGYWPEHSAKFYHQLLRGLRIDLWLAKGAYDGAENWLEEQRSTLSENDWCSLLISYAQRLQQLDRHTEAEERLRAALKHYPKYRPLLLQLAELAQLQGRSAQSNALVRRAIRNAHQAGEPTVGLWLQLAQSSLLRNVPLAEHALAKARDVLDSLPTGSITEALRAALEFQYRLVLAGLYAQQQEIDKAETEYRELLSEQPENLGVLQGLGQLLMQLGRIDEAVECFETIKTQDPARGHAALINASRYPEDDATLKQLEAIARTPGQEGSVRASLLLQLAKTFEKRGDYDHAFTLANDANQSAARLLNYNPAAHRQRCARIRHAFNTEFFKHRPPEQYGLDTQVPVFVVGMPRSGTTLVEQLLAGHSQIHGAGELGLITGAIAGLERWERRTGSGRHYPDCADDLTPKVARGIAKNLLDELQSYAPEAKHVVDKLPHNFENIGLIKFLFPRAKIISVRRDPRDIALSNYFTDYAAKHGGMGFAYNLDWIGEQLADHNLLMHHWQQLFPNDILEVQYEEVIANPEASAKKMLDYIGVSWEADVLNFAELNRPVKTASVWQVRQPIYHTSKAKWRRYQNHLQPLIAATNRKITWEPISMVSLPEPGWLNTGVDAFQAGNLNEAERCFKHLLHFVPEHGAAQFMLGLVYASKGHFSQAIELMEKGFKRCPWNRDWKADLAQAYRLNGEPDKANALEQKQEQHNNQIEETTSESEFALTSSSGVY